MNPYESPQATMPRQRINWRGQLMLALALLAAAAMLDAWHSRVLLRAEQENFSEYRETVRKQFVLRFSASPND